MSATLLLQSEEGYLSDSFSMYPILQLSREFIGVPV